MKKRDLSAIRSRVERLASQALSDGCRDCREWEPERNIVWDDYLAPGRIQTSTTCRTCGRRLPFVVLSWLQNDPEDD